MIDLNSGSGYALFRNAPAIGEQINDLIDGWMRTENRSQAKRTYVSTSGIGRSCLRQIQYDFTATPVDEGRDFDGATLRRFQSGHVGEPLIAEWLRKAGFDLRTEQDGGKQFGFATAWKDGVARFRGHIDGVILGCSTPISMAFPALWENKVMGAKTWNDTVKRGVAIAKPVYAAQIALYQAYMGLQDNPALFTSLNRDTWELYCELVPFDAALAQRMSDRAVQVIQATDGGEDLPRVAHSRDYFECRYCAWQDRCWGGGV